MWRNPADEETKAFSGCLIVIAYMISSAERFDLRVAAPASRFRVRDSVGDILKDCADMGVLDDLRLALNEGTRSGADAAQVVRDLVYELAGAENRELAVDVLIHATGVAAFEHRTLREYARRHGMSHEGFRRQVIAMQARLGLTPRPRQHSDAN